MEIALARCSVIAVGAWNVAIFTPEWIKEHLQDQGRTWEVRPVFAMGDIAVQAVLDNRVEFLVSGNKLQARPRQPDDAVFSYMESQTTRLLNKLPDTPVHGVGVNIAYDITTSNALFGSILELADSEALRSVGADIQMTGVQRRFIYHDRVLNLSIDREFMGPIHLDLNFHFDVTPPSARSAASCLADRVIELRKEADGLVRGVYRADGQ